MNYKRPFHNEVVFLLESFLEEQNIRFPKENIIKIDLHCHDYNSDIPDELLGRILGVSETWLSSEDLIASLKKHGCCAFTITNHNNARSCFKLLEMGLDVLVGAEFSCIVPDYKIGIHVLAYGFTPSQEEKLNDLRSDIYKFQEFAYENDIPTIWAHPFYNHCTDKTLPMEFFDKMALLFERFEVINGQRDSWQNMLVKEWLGSLTKDRINEISRQMHIPPDRYCKSPYKKSMSGGSDCHMGIFTGLTGTLLHIENLESNLKILKKSELALKAIKKGDMAPYGSHNDSEKMAVAFLDYFCQIAINMREPGLLRMFLHKGTPQDKLIALFVANGFSEIKQHKVTMNFLELFHNCFTGNAPNFMKRLFVSRKYRPIFDQVYKLAEIRKYNSKNNIDTYKETLQFIYNQMSGIFFSRLKVKIEQISKDNGLSKVNINKIVESIELPAYLRSYTHNGKSKLKNGMTSINISEFLDGLSFPFLASVIILSAFFTSARVLYNVRPLLKNYADRLGKLKHPCRMLWLTDTFEDNNGVSIVLKSILDEVKRRDLPIDIMVCSSKLQSSDHLIVIPSVSEFVLPFYQQQPLRIPNFLDIYNIFREREYDRIICSTEGPMGLASLFLKQAYSVPAYFYIHTDWIMFAQKILNFDRHYRDRLRRIIRAFYRNFDGLFVLNSDQQNWLLGKDMNFDAGKVFLTAHWSDDKFYPKQSKKEEIFDVTPDTPILLFTGRMSNEKGVMEIPSIFKKVRASIPNVQIAFAGQGPNENDLKLELPDAIYLGWVAHDKMPDIYSSADMFILPSNFDTFGCVVLEALSCGLPVSAYMTKGPKDIILNGKNGYLVKNKTEMANSIIDYLSDKKLQQSFKEYAVKRSQEFDSVKIIDELLKNVHLAV